MDAIQLLISHNEEETRDIGRKIGSLLTKGSVVSLVGVLGSGKTILAKGIAQALGVKETLVSPTFTLIQEYMGNVPLYHMDLYRIEGFDDFIAIGGEEYMYGNGVTLIEWGDRIASYLPLHTIEISIEYKESHTRQLSIRGAHI